MNISGIRPQSGFYQTTETSDPMREAGLAALSLNDNASFADNQEELGASIEISSAGKRNQTFGSYDYANQYRPDQLFDIKSSRIGMMDGNVQKAVSVMQKDEMLHQYQKFVGEVGGGMIARPMEDFTL